MCKRKKQIEQATQLGEENPCYRSMLSLQWEDLFEGKTRQKLADDLAMFIIASDKLETHAISRFFSFFVYDVWWHQAAYHRCDMLERIL